MGAHLGGVFLAFPAILLASLTIVAKKEGAAKARDDARGAALGTLGLMAFGVVAAVALARWPPVGSLAAATAAWAVVSVAAFGVLYLLGAGADEHDENAADGEQDHGEDDGVDAGGDEGGDDGHEPRVDGPDRQVVAPVPLGPGHRARPIPVVPLVVAIVAMVIVVRLRRSRGGPALPT